MKWVITRPGARWCLTTSAPRIAWPITPSGSSAPKSARCQRNGRRNQASRLAAITAKPTKPVSTPVAVLDHRVGVERRHRAP